MFYYFIALTVTLFLLLVTSWSMYKRYIFSIPEALHRFSPTVRRIIIEKFANAKKYLRLNEEGGDVHLDPLLYIIEWDEQNLQHRGITKATVINRMYKIINFTFFCCISNFFFLHILEVLG